MEVIRILEGFGFAVVRIKGSHHRMQRVVTVKNPDDNTSREETQVVSVAVHGRKELPIGTLRTIYRDALRYIPESELEEKFYTK
jgi:predicted RNA binding protein YcfA (HicA-like mRNA interferase family)